MGGHNIHQRANTQRDLQDGKMQHSHRASPRRPCQRSADAWAEPRVSKERENEREGGGGEHPVIKLRGRRVLEHVAPPEIGAVGTVRVEGAEHLLDGRNEAGAHARELVVDESGVEARDETAGHGGEEDHRGDDADGAPEQSQVRVRERGEFGECGFRVRVEEPVLAQDREPVPDHGGVDGEGGGEVRGEAVLRYAWVGARLLEEVVLDT